MTVTPTHTNAERSLESETCRAVVFTIANHLLALPLTTVLKVVSQSVIQNDYPNVQSVIYLENQPITLLNLHPCLSTVPGNNVSNRSVLSAVTSGQFLLITGLQGHAQWAIPVDQPPTLMELPLSTVRQLPIAYRQLIQNLACHVSVLTNQRGLSTILLLNLKQASGLVQ